MFWKSTISQVKALLRKKEALGVFFILLVMVLLNFIGNVLAFQGSDAVEMYHPMKIMLLSYNRFNYNASATLQLIQIFPFLVVFPAGFSLAKEWQLGENVYLSARLGIPRYKWSKMLAAFITTAIVFTVPFLIEMVLNCISFPLNATGDMSNLGCYDKLYLESVQRYLMSGLYVKNPYFYAFIGILIFGAVSGLLGAFTVAVSSLIKVKYNVFLFLPVFLLLDLPGMLMKGKGKFSCNWYDYLLLFNDRVKSTSFFLISTGILLLFVIAASVISSRKDCL